MIRNVGDAKLYLKRVVKTALGRDHLLRRDVWLRTTRIGTEYGGWVFAPDALPARHPVILSFGLGDDISFDLGMIARYGAEVHGFDPTPMSLDWLSRQQIPPEMHVSAVGISDHDGEEDFAFPHIEGWDDFSVRRKSDRLVRCKVARLSTIIGELGLPAVDIGKLDVEGSEYKVIADLERSPLLPRQFLVEFHHGMHGIAVQETRDAVARLRELDYRLFDISPWGREFSFIHRSAL